MTAILALHSSNAQYFVLEGIDLYIGWYIDTNQLVVLFCLLVWCFHINKTVLVPVTHYVNDGTVEQAKKEMRNSQRAKEKELEKVNHLEKSSDPDKKQKIKDEIDKAFSLT